MVVNWYFDKYLSNLNKYLSSIDNYESKVFEL